MTAFTDFLENELLDHVLRNNAYTAPTTIYVGLYTTATSDAGGGTEVTGGAYARQTMAFDIAAAGATQNTADVTFPTATASWGTVTHAALLDAVTAGNMLFHGILTASKTVAIDDTFKFNLGDFDVALD